jgi:hypothetical protein
MQTDRSQMKTMPHPSTTRRRHLLNRSATGAAWGQERRLEFIEFRLLWDGKINRKELVTFFGTSIQQASLDLARYIELAPDNLRYDSSEKVYRAARTLSPVFAPAESEEYLSQLTATVPDTPPPPLSFIGWCPPYEIIRSPARAVSPDVLMRVIWAIRDREDLDMSYQSMRHVLPTRRWISPHSLGSDGSRWHVRAWCHQEERFRDFVLARFQKIHAARVSTTDAATDERWHSFATVILRVRSSLAPGQRAAVEAEFGMTDGTLEIRLRDAMLPYLVRQLRLDLDPTTDAGTQLIEWVNQKDLASLMPASDGPGEVLGPPAALSKVLTPTARIRQ